MIPTSMSVLCPATRVLSDPELVAAVCSGRAEALDVLFHRYGRLVHRVATGILKDRGEAEDSTQEVFFEIFRKAHLYDPDRGPVRGWLLRYAYRRSLRRRVILTRRAGYSAEPIEAADAAPRRMPRLTPDECRWLLRAGLEQLPERQRTTLELACFEDLALRDVADRLGVSLGCARHYYYRGLARLQQWARLTTPERSAARRGGAPDDKADGATARAPRPCVPI